MQRIIYYAKSKFTQDLISFLSKDYLLEAAEDFYNLFTKISQVEYAGAILDLEDEKDFKIIPTLHNLDATLPLIVTASNISETAQKKLRTLGVFYFFTPVVEFTEIKKVVEDALKFSTKERRKNKMLNSKEDSLLKKERRETLEKKIPRRTFIDYLLGGSLGLVALSILGGVFTFLYPSKRVIESQEEISVGNKSNIPPGKGKVFPYRDKAVLVINTQQGFVALSAVCTHRCCLLTWREEKKEILCPCHGGKFDVKGNILGGPPAKHLTNYKVVLRDEKIFVYG